MCTSIKLKNTKATVLDQNYDFYYGHGLIITNQRGIYKVSLTDDITGQNLYSNDNNAVKWISKYGSVTFNQFARELPICGINEAGLSIVSMWHNTAQKPTENGEKQINELQWIQMQLDLYSTLQEVTKNLDNVTLSVKMMPMHYHVSDKTGESVIIELVNGKLTAFSNKNISACGNAGINETMEYLKKYDGINPSDITIKEPILDRASKAILESRDYNDRDSPEDIRRKAFCILDSVHQQVGPHDLFQWLKKGTFLISRL
jgi:choloylglycine hydrolase